MSTVLEAAQLSSFLPAAQRGAPTGPLRHYFAMMYEPTSSGVGNDFAAANLFLWRSMPLVGTYLEVDSGGATGYSVYSPANFRFVTNYSPPLNCLSR